MYMNEDNKRVVTGKVRLSYVNLITPRAQKLGDKLKYSTTLLIPKADVAAKQRIDAAVSAAIQEGITSKWSGATPVQVTVPIYDGDGVRLTGEYFPEECKGHWVMTASSELKPQIVDINMNEIMNPNEIYSGMYARVSIRFFPYFNSGKKGIGCGLGNVQKLEDGEALGGRTNAAEDFGVAANGYNIPSSTQIPAYTLQTQFPEQSLYNQQMPQYYQQPTSYFPQQMTSQQAPAYNVQTQSVSPQLPMYIDPITGGPISSGVMRR
jgi:hypothetical protein